VKLLRAHHLHDEALVDTYLLARAGTAAAPPTAEHLADCGSCSQRYAELARVLDDARAAADADLDELFPAEQLRSQRLRIAQRLAHVGRSARVLTFPAVQAGRGLTASGPRVATRWIAAAAAAGLFAGVGVGVFFDQSRVQTRVASLQHTRPVQLPAVVRHQAASTPANATQESDDEAFLSDLDLALESPQTRVLVVYDRLTPHVRDASDIR
jgi:anti-sigma factor RsiW